MSEEYGVSVTLKGGTGYDEPWIVSRGIDFADAMRRLAGVNMAAVRAAAADFHSASSLSPQGVVEQGFPGSQVIDQAPAAAAPMQVAQQPQPSGYQPQASQVNPGQASQQSQHQASLNPPCPTCGGPTAARSGNKNGKNWSGFFCPTRGHDAVWNR